jgi:hypothetical protein
MAIRRRCAIPSITVLTTCSLGTSPATPAKANLPRFAKPAALREGERPIVPQVHDERYYQRGRHDRPLSSQPVVSHTSVIGEVQWPRFLDPNKAQVPYWT